MRLRALALFGFKISVSIGILYYLSQRMDLSGLGGRIAALWSWNLLIAEVFFVVGLALGIRRWQIILAWQGSPLAFWQLFRIGWIASFFGMFLPAGAGRDVVRGAYLLRLGVSILGITRSVLTDRFVGVVSLSLLSLPCIAWLFWESPELGAVAWFLALVCFGLGLALLALRVVLPKLEQSAKSTGRGLLMRAARPLSSVARDLLDLRLAGWPLALSCLAHGAMVASVYSIGGLGNEDAAPLWTYALFLPAILLLTQLPISVAGLGVREAAFVSLFGVVGIAPEVALAMSLTFFALVVVNNIGGVGLYLLSGERFAVSQ